MPFIHPAVWQPGCVTEGLELRPIITQCFPLATLFRAISPLTAARGWQAITKPRFCSRGSSLKQTKKLLCSRTGRIRASKSSSISSVRTFACHFYTIIVMSVWNSGLFMTLGWNPALYLFDIRFYCATSHSDSVVIIPFVQAACSTSRRTTRTTASRPRITRPSPSSSPHRRIACSTSSSCTC